ncbi:MAG: holo-ACP synthase [Candidatus Thorarchaeota archaeon]
MSIGIDLVEVKRFTKYTKDSPFIQRVYSDNEVEYCFSYSDPSPHLASTFAGKEAVVKALGIETPSSLSGIEILRKESGVPYVLFSKASGMTLLVSLTHTSEHAAAVVLAYSDSQSFNSVSVQKLLNDNIQDILPDE